MAELVAKRYGQALFELAVESGKVDDYYHEIQALIEILNADNDLIEVLDHPKLSNNEKIGILEGVFEGKVDKDIMGFLVLAVQKGRQENIVEILEYTLEKINESKGYENAYVTSAVELNDQDKAAIVERLETLTKKKITLITSVDTSVIGGLFIRINDRVVDNTVRGALKRMSRDIYEARV